MFELHQQGTYEYNKKVWISTEPFWNYILAINFFPLYKL